MSSPDPPGMRRQASTACCSVLELRQYTLFPGQRDVLIDLFDREFVESQEAVGMSVVGQFRDLEDPDRFVWLRGFRDMASRAAALQAFYGGPVWQAHRDAANATMADSSDVLLLRPIHPGSGFPPAEIARPPVGCSDRSAALVVATICHLHAAVDDEFLRAFERRVKPLLAAAGAQPLACFQTEPAENTYPALPVRTGESAFTWFSRFASRDQYRSKSWNEMVLPELSARLRSPPLQLQLEPTARSLLR